MLSVQAKSYSSGSIWQFLSEDEANKIKSFYDVLIKFKDNTEFVTYLYSTTDKTHPKSTESGYYDEQTCNEISEYINSLNDLEKLPHQKNKMIHGGIDNLLQKLNISSNWKVELYSILESLAIRIIKHEYNIDITTDWLKQSQLTWYTDGDYIQFHNDGPSEAKLCALLIYLSPEEYYKMGSGGELVLKDRREIVDVVYPVLGTYSIIDFTKNNPFHGVHKVMGDFNRFAYLNFVKE